MPRNTNQNKKYTIIKVPSDSVEDIERYLRSLSVNDNSPVRLQVLDQEPEDDIMEVKKVLNHRVDNNTGQWSFQLLWVDKTKSWEVDEDCYCESLIKKYLLNKNIRTAYVFCRVSTPDQAKSTNVSLDAQKSEIMGCVDITFYERIKVFTVSESAYKSIPKSLKYIGECCLPGDGIFIWRVDRLSRNIVKYLEWLENLNDRNVSLYSQQEKIYYSKNKLDFIQAIVNAQREAQILGERIKSSYRRKIERGDEAIGKLPYGKMYNRIVSNSGDTIRKVVVNNKEEQILIRKIKNSHLSPRKLCDLLNSEGFRNKNKRWNVGMVRRIQKNY